MTSPSETDSERRFAEYLTRSGLSFERDHVVGPTGRNVDFFIHNAVLCDVKEVREGERTEEEVRGEIITVDRQIRRDIRRLREKFDRPPALPVVLVTMNYSDQVFTGQEIVTAMLGDAGWTFAQSEHRVLSEVHHLPRGNAALTKSHNTAISGVLAFDVVLNLHAFFASPFASIPLQRNFFPDVDHLDIRRSSLSDADPALNARTYFSANLTKRT